MKNDMSDLEQIAYAKTVYGQEEIDAVVKCLSESTQMGNYSRQFERKIADLFNKKHCLYVNSGSSALFIGVEAFSFPAGGEVITPALTFSTSIGCLVKNDLIPVFVDVEPLTYCIDVSQIKAQITEKTVAILAPNLMGNLCDWPSIREIADKYNLIVIEDSADTLGATINGQGSGFYSDMSITSFYGSHIINCAGNGGALMLNDKNVIDKAKLLRSWGRSSSLFDEKSEEIENRFNINLGGIEYDAKFVFETVGYNVEGSELEVIEGIDLIKYHPSLITIENNNLLLEDYFKDDVYKILISNDYVFINSWLNHVYEYPRYDEMIKKLLQSCRYMMVINSVKFKLDELIPKADILLVEIHDNAQYALIKGEL